MTSPIFCCIPAMEMTGRRSDALSRRRITALFDDAPQLAARRAPPLPVVRPELGAHFAQRVPPGSTRATAVRGRPSRSRTAARAAESAERCSIVLPQRQNLSALMTRRPRPRSINGRSISAAKSSPRSGGKRGHLGSALSLVEIMRVLYDDVLRYARRIRLGPSATGSCSARAMAAWRCTSSWPTRDSFRSRRLTRFCRSDAILGGHPEHPRFRASKPRPAALGHGLSIAVGLALAARIGGATAASSW